MVQPQTLTVIFRDSLVVKFLQTFVLKFKYFYIILKVFVLFL